MKEINGKEGETGSVTLVSTENGEEKEFKTMVPLYISAWIH